MITRIIPALMALVLATPAAAQTATSCAAFWAAAADVRRIYRGLYNSPEPAETLAEKFRALARKNGLADDEIARLIARDRAGFRLLHRAYLAGDPQSTALHDRFAQGCAELLGD